MSDAAECDVESETVPTRTETDSMGPIEVPDHQYWGAQTQRSLHHFSIGDELMPAAVIRGMAILKKAAALVNRDLDKLSQEEADLIVRAADEILDGKHDDVPESAFLLKGTIDDVVEAANKDR